MPSGGSSRKIQSVVVFLLVWGISGYYMATHLRRGWVPLDEGALAQSAERAMNGELPHRDFIEVYTGGLTVLNAFAFRHLGTDLFSMRIVLYVFFLAWVPAVYFIASELAPGWAAAGITLLAIAWSVPNYAAAMPSWYNLFFATFGIAAFFRYVKRPAAVWLFLAGACVGLSFLAKSVALYFLAALLVYCIFREQSLSAARAPRTGRRALLYFSFVVLFPVTLVALFAVLVGAYEPPQQYVEFVLPTALLTFLLIAREEMQIPGTDRERFATLFRMVGPLLAGAALPVAIFLCPYLRSHCLGTFFWGVFVLPLKRISGASRVTPSVITQLPLVALVGLVIVFARSRGWLRRFSGVLLSLPLAALLVISFSNTPTYRVVWRTAEGVIPFLTLLGVLRLLGYPRSLPPLAAPAQERLLLLVSGASLCAVVRFPFASPNYFCYIAPLAVLACAALIGTFPAVPGGVRAALAGYYFVFAVFAIAPGFIYTMGVEPSPDRQTHTLKLPRAGHLRVSPDRASTYERLIPLVREHAGSGGILAVPDCPEVYFLAGKRNPTRMLFDFFEDQDVRERQLLRLAEDPAIKVLVLNAFPAFSGSYPSAWNKKMTQQFEKEQYVGMFQVWWRR